MRGLEGCKPSKKIGFAGGSGGKAARTTRKREIFRGPAAPAPPPGEFASSIIRWRNCKSKYPSQNRKSRYAALLYPQPGNRPSAAGAGLPPCGKRACSRDARGGRRQRLERRT